MDFTASVFFSFFLGKDMNYSCLYIYIYIHISLWSSFESLYILGDIVLV